MLGQGANWWTADGHTRWGGTEPGKPHPREHRGLKPEIDSILESVGQKGSACARHCAGEWGQVRGEQGAGGGVGEKWASRKEVGLQGQRHTAWHPALGLVGGLASLKPGSEQTNNPRFITVPEAKPSWTLIRSASLPSSIDFLTLSSKKTVGFLNTNEWNTISRCNTHKYMYYLCTHITMYMCICSHLAGSMSNWLQGTLWIWKSLYFQVPFTNGHDILI